MFQRALRWLPFVLLVVLATVSSVYAATKTYTLTYQELLAAVAPAHYYPKFLNVTKDPQVSTSWKVVINHTITFNASVNYPMFGFIVTPIATTGTYDNVSIPQVRIHFWLSPDGKHRFTVFYNNGTHAYHTPNLGGYLYVLPVTVLVRNSTITFWDSSTLNVTRANLVPVKPLYVGYKAFPSRALTSGTATLTIEYSAPVQNLTDIVMQFIPVVLLIAMLSAAYAMLEKMSR